jgi:hypothetical protein
LRIANLHGSVPQHDIGDDARNGSCAVPRRCFDGELQRQQVADAADREAGLVDEAVAVVVETVRILAVRELRDGGAQGDRGFVGRPDVAEQDEATLVDEAVAVLVGAVVGLVRVELEPSWSSRREGVPQTTTPAVTPAGFWKVSVDVPSALVGSGVRNVEPTPRSSSATRSSVRRADVSA